MLEPIIISIIMVVLLSRLMKGEPRDLVQEPMRTHPLLPLLLPELRELLADRRDRLQQMQMSRLPLLQLQKMITPIPHRKKTMLSVVHLVPPRDPDQPLMKWESK